MASEFEDRDASAQLLKYTKRRDLILVGCVVIYVLGPVIYNWIESLNDIETKTKRIDFSDLYKGEERMLYRIHEEISELRWDIRHQQPFGWRDVAKDLSR